MTIRPNEFDRRFDQHVAAARAVAGKVVTKSADYYGGSLEDATIRQDVKDRCQKLGINGQFGEMNLNSQKCLRLWSKTNGTG